MTDDSFDVRPTWEPLAWRRQKDGNWKLYHRHVAIMMMRFDYRARVWDCFYRARSVTDILDLDFDLFILDGSLPELFRAWAMFSVIGHDEDTIEMPADLVLYLQKLAAGEILERGDG